MINSTKVIITTIFFFISFTTTFAQKCEAEIQQIDEMTDEKIEAWGGKLSGQSAIMTGKGYTAQLYLGTDNVKKKEYAVVFLRFEIPPTDADTFDSTFQEGDEMLFKSEGGLVKIPITDIGRTQKRVLSKFYINYKLEGEISRDQIEQISKNKIIMFRIPTAQGGKVEAKVGKKASKKMLEQFTCYYNTLL